ncbi:hypothetical protein [Streptomyces fructofermentans]|uniref:Uncharacterized protein n=1 Tax=Streptomyces fructofermentans TaxID=152141 RepID=A0A918U5M6_9ACTN|nr:hypothetical protein [Streptomyces fructofermentans]GGX96597.1 hypothetical protein GCM10010515_73940 [Streptomyces fructofermentans]
MQVEVSGEVLAGLVGRYFLGAEIPAVESWRSPLEEMHARMLTGNLETKGYWTDLYRARRDTAAVLNTGMADDLERVIGELSSSEEENLALIMFQGSGFGYMTWVSQDFSFVVSCIRVSDKRIRK